MPDVFTKEKRKEIMSKIKSKNTNIERIMMEALVKNNIVFKYQPKLLGKPDFLIPPNLTVFCDSTFWHGRNWSTLKRKLPDAYWRQHIGATVKRDRKINEELGRQGYRVLRFWDDEITKNIQNVLEKILHEQEKR